MLAATLAIPSVASAGRIPVAPTDVTVEFGQNQFPQDAAPFNHLLDPEEVTILKGGTGAIQTDVT
jgi:hypothetical protein